MRVLKAVKLQKFVKPVGIVLTGVFIFYTGVMFGNGTVRIGQDAIFSKSVQKNLPANLDYSSVEEVYDALWANYDGQLERDKLLDGLKEGLVRASGDDYTEYLNKEEAKQFDEELNGTFEGIGAELGKDDKLVIIVSPISGTPADKAGLKPRDAIIEINGESAYDISVEIAKNKIRGPKGTKVTLKVLRGENQELTFEITRDTITVPSIKSEIIEGNIGYLKLHRFGEDTARLSRAAAQNFKNAGVRGVILDVRDNPGGLLDGAVEVSGIWLSNKTVLEEKRDGKVVRTFTSKRNPILNGIYTVVLVNGGSASASEIVAGALKDNGAATLIGEKSFGKGSVQQLLRLPAGDVLKVTIARWFTPGGKNIDKEGIEPDQKVERSDEDYRTGRDPQKDSAIEYLKR